MQCEACRNLGRTIGLHIVFPLGRHRRPHTCDTAVYSARMLFGPFLLVLQATRAISIAVYACAHSSLMHIYSIITLHASSFRKHACMAHCARRFWFPVLQAITLRSKTQLAMLQRAGGTVKGVAVEVHGRTRLPAPGVFSLTKLYRDILNAMLSDCKTRCWRDR